MPEKPIFAEYELINTAVAQMKSISSVIDAKLDVLRKELAEVQWVGTSQVSWAMHQQQWDEAVNELNSLLQLIAMKVDRAKENYITTENEVARDWRNATL